MHYSLSGIWTATLKDLSSYPMNLPGTLDESEIGYPDTMGKHFHPDSDKNEALTEQSVITTRFTRKYSYEGSVTFSKKVTLPENIFLETQPRIFLKAERARCLSLFVNNLSIPLLKEASLSTPYIFELTSALTPEELKQEVEFAFISDNSYPGLPRMAITYSSTATDETQTNWNGILGEFTLYTKEKTFIQSVCAYPTLSTVTLKITINSSEEFNGTLTISSKALKDVYEKSIHVNKGIGEITINDVDLSDTISYWDEEEGNLYELSASLSNGSHETITFGIRTFSVHENRHFSLNGRPVFLRGEANCAAFPETGHPPMTIHEWEEILQTYLSYGVNHVRFHSHCPPEAAFFAADKLGMLMQPELSQWDPEHSMESDESYEYYQKEITCIIEQLANHPSFVMLTLGNESKANEFGHERMRSLLSLAKEMDPTRLYADGSNVHYGWAGCDNCNDFYTSQQYYGEDLRATFACQDKERRKLFGFLNNEYPNAKHNYDNSMAKIRESFSGPFFVFEVGQYEILPDFSEIEFFQGISKPDNLSWIKQNVEKAGMRPCWEKYVEATGELSKLCYREEVEAALRTKEYSGLSLLGLQDFPGQGTALVGMLNSHLMPKPYNFAKPEEFKKFFTGTLPLVLLPKYTYTCNETLEAEVIIANYGKTDLNGDILYSLGKQHGTISNVTCPLGELTSIGTISIPLDNFEPNTKSMLTVSIAAISNTYPVWIYRDVTPVCPKPVYETKHLDETAKQILAQGGCVYLSPDSTKDQLPLSIQGQFSTDFWSVGTFPAQEGGMGLYIEHEHPVFEHFPTEYHTNWQWWAMASQRALILPKQYETIVTQLDSYAYLKPMAMLLECRCGNGKLLLSTMGLQNLQDYPEAKALLFSIYSYLDSPAFHPAQEISFEILKTLVQ